MLGYCIDIADDRLDAASAWHAVEKIAGQAETLADEMERGALADRGGPDALRLLAAMVRLGGWGAPAASGHA